MSAGRIVRNIVYRVDAEFPHTHLSTAATRLSGVAWADPANPRARFAIPFWACGVAPYEPRATKQITTRIYSSAGGVARLHLCDETGQHFARWLLGLQSIYVGAGPTLQTLTWEPNWHGSGVAFDPTVNPLAYACGLEYELERNASADLLVTDLGTPARFVFVPRAGVHQFLETPADMTYAWPEAAIVFEHGAPATLDCSMFWALSVAASVDYWPARRYSRWRLELATAADCGGVAIPVIYAQGPVSGDRLQAADWHNATYWNDSTKVLKNPGPVGWQKRILLRLIVW